MWGREYKKIMNRIALVFGFIGFSFLLWLSVSVADVAIHNYHDSDNIGAWNAFRTVCEVR